jgi:hypothetical protein
MTVRSVNAETQLAPTLFLAVGVVVSALIAWLAPGWFPISGGLPALAWVLAVSSLIHVLIGRHCCWVVALLLAVGAVSFQLVVLVVRTIQVGAEVVSGFPWESLGRLGFGPEGVWTLGVLFVACAVSLLSSGERRLFTCLFWLTVLIGAWACLLIPTYRVTALGGFQRSGNTLALLACLSTLLAAGGLTGRWLENTEGQNPERTWPGFRASCGALGIAVLLLTCFHLAQPTPFRMGGHAWGCGVVGCMALLAAVPLIVLGAPLRTGYLLDLGLGLISLGLAGIAVLAFMPDTRPLAEGYPKIFNAQVVGLAAAAGLWTWEWKGRSRRCTFLTICLALLIVFMTAVWPKLPGNGASDDSLERVTAGLGTNLFLTLVAFRAARRWGGASFLALGLLALLGSVGFLAVRLLPFVSRSD